LKNKSGSTPKNIDPIKTVSSTSRSRPRKAWNVAGPTHDDGGGEERERRIAHGGGEQEEKSDYTGPHRESAGSDGRSHARIDDESPHQGCAGNSLSNVKCKGIESD
jgi:hypothetical protein